MSSDPTTSTPFAREVATVSLETRMKSAYLDYAMSVIVGRALPDVRDGLKPVHRRILFAMHEAGNSWNKPFKKSARIVGDVLGKYHPHGQDAVYDALVRMAQEFSMRAPLVDGQGNFGSIDGDNPAAMRYTEVRMAKIAHALLDDLDKETVAFAPNYDGAEQEPTVLPTRLPNLLVNGSSGIAVGMATNIPPHNLGETVDACLHLLKHPDAEIEALMAHLPAPDFPTAGTIYGVSGVRDAYHSGRGRVVMRARTHREELDKNRSAIIVDELPYQVNKASLIARIAELVREKKLEGIGDLRDESDRAGIRVVIELRRGENADVVLNNLYKETQLQETFSVNMVALHDGAPRQMNLRDILSHFLAHRREVVVRRTLYDLRRARAQAHLLEGFAVAVANVDAIVELIKTSPSPAAAEDALCTRTWPAGEVAAMLAKLKDPQLVRPEDIRNNSDLGLQSGKKPVYVLSRAQAKAILDLRLARLTGMEREKINNDYAEMVAKISDLLDLLASSDKISAVIGEELKEVKKQFGTPRRSEIVEDAAEIDNEQLIAREEMVVTFSHQGYVKRQAVSEYRAQRRGGRGKQAATAREDDFISRLFTASTHDYLLLFTNRGRVYWKKVYNLPLGSRIGRGKPVAGVLELSEGETVQTVLPVADFSGTRYVVMATAKGVVKKTPLESFSRPRRGGIAAINLDVGDRLINVAVTSGDGTVLLFSDAGKALRFRLDAMRAIGRTARGVIGMRLPSNQYIVSMLVLEPSNDSDAILVANRRGGGKRTSVDKFPVKGRGGQGVIAMKLDAQSNAVVGATIATDDDHLMLITDGGVLVRTAMRDIRKMGRGTQGVRLINLDEGRQLISIARVVEQDKDDNDGDGDSDNGGGGDAAAQADAGGKAEGDDTA